MRYVCARCHHEYRWHTKFDRVERCDTWECRCSGYTELPVSLHAPSSGSEASSLLSAPVTPCDDPATAHSYTEAV